MEVWVSAVRPKESRSSLPPDVYWSLAGTIDGEDSLSNNLKAVDLAELVIRRKRLTEPPYLMYQIWVHGRVWRCIYSPWPI
jgi:hypothetical protein